VLRLQKEQGLFYINHYPENIFDKTQLYCREVHLQWISILPDYTKTLENNNNYFNISIKYYNIIYITNIDVQLVKKRPYHKHMHLNLLLLHNENRLCIVCYSVILWNTDTGHDTDTDMPTEIIIWKNDIVQCNHRCRVGVGHRRCLTLGHT